MRTKKIQLQIPLGMGNIYAKTAMDMGFHVKSYKVEGMNEYIFIVTGFKSNEQIYEYGVIMSKLINK